MNRRLNSYITIFYIIILVLITILGTHASIPINNAPLQNQTGQINQVELILTEDEKQWLKEHPVIKVGSDPNWAPFEYRDENGQYQGIDIQYLKLIEQKLGIKFVMCKEKNWQDIIQKSYSKEIDILTGINETYERKKHFNFTNIYITHPISIFSYKDITHIRNLDELSGEKVAVVDGYYTNELLKTKYPTLNLILVETPRDALKLLNKKKVVAYVEGMVIANYYINERNYKNIGIVGETPFSYELRLAVRKDWTTLHSILQKALQTISESEKEYIYYNGISARADKKFNFRLFFLIIIPCLLVLLFFIIWNRKLSKEVHRRKQAQEALNNAIKELKDTQTHLVQSEKMSTVGELTAGIAHEIKNPLNFIMMGMDGITNGVDAYEKIITAYEKMHTKLTEQDIIYIQNLKENLDYHYYRYECESLTKSVQEGVENIHEITKSLNTFSYFAGKEMVLSNINDSLKSTLVILRNQYKYSIEIIKDFGDIPDIKCYPGKLNQVFVNIISNAIQAIEDKGTIHIKTYTEDNYLKIQIKDSGKGMSKEVLDNIFTPFYTTKEIGKGTGLGLSISKNIIDEHKGTIDVSSEIGEGTEFIINLPIH